MGGAGRDKGKPGGGVCLSGCGRELAARMLEGPWAGSTGSLRSFSRGTGEVRGYTRRWVGETELPANLVGTGRTEGFPQLQALHPFFSVSGSV